MTPILFEATETSFATNGIGRIPCISCIVKEERNGVYECTFVVSISEDIYPQITEGRIIYCIHDDAKDAQPFDIYSRSAPMDGQVTFYAHHISYRLNKITVGPFTASTCSGALTAIGTNSINSNPFSFWTNKSVTATMKNTVPTTARVLLAGQSGSVLDVYGKGEYKWDKWDVRLYTNRGEDKGVTIRYGKNLTDIKQDTDLSQAYNAVAPYWTSGSDGTIVTLTAGMVVDTAHVVNNQIKCIPLDLSSEFEDAPTQQQLEAAATAHLAAASGWVMKTNLAVDFVALWQSPEYEQYAGLERVSLCDKVSVIHPQLGVAANKIEVISVEYDVLRERYVRMELGEPKNTFAEVIKADAIKAVMAQVPSTDVMQEAIAHATDKITGVNGGNVIINRDANGKPYELLIMDTDSVMTAVDVWRWNLNGLGHSHNGYSGPYNDVALTADGQINANLITTGVLRAIQIINGNGTFVANADGSVTASAINITGGSINITTNAEDYDVIGLSYLTPAQNLIKSEYSPLQARFDSASASGSSSARYQAGGAMMYSNDKLKAWYNNTQASFYYDDNAGNIGAAYNISGATYRDNAGTLMAVYGNSYANFYNSSEQLRAEYKGAGMYLYNDSGVNKVAFTGSGLLYKNDSGVSAAKYDSIARFYGSDGVKTLASIGNTGVSVYDNNGDLSATVSSIGLSMYGDNGSGVRVGRGLYQIGGVFFYASDGTYRTNYSLSDATFRDASAKQRTTINADGVRVRDSAEKTRALLYTGALMFYASDGTTNVATYAPGGVTLYDNLGQATAKVTTSGFDIRNDATMGVSIDGAGYSNTQGHWVWKTFNSTDNVFCYVPCWVPY